MFRIKICYHIKDNWIRASLTSKNFNKFTYTVGNTYIIRNNNQHWDEFLYQLKKSCTEIIRDELHRKYGNDWRKYEQPKLVWSSYISAINRMQPAYINKH